MKFNPFLGLDSIKPCVSGDKVFLFIKIKDLMKSKIMKLFRGEASNANGIRIIYYIPFITLDNWSAKFSIDKITKHYSTIENNYVEVILDEEDTKDLPLGINYGWFKLIDHLGYEATVNAQKFIVLEG